MLQHLQQRGTEGSEGDEDAEDAEDALGEATLAEEAHDIEDQEPSVTEEYVPRGRVVPERVNYSASEPGARGTSILDDEDLLARAFKRL
jgi:hypothetical protein